MEWCQTIAMNFYVTPKIVRWKRFAKIVSPYFQVFEDPIKDDSITEFEYLEYLRNDSSNMNKLREHKIKTRDLDEYLLPYKAMLEVRGKLVKEADDTNYAAIPVMLLYQLCCYRCHHTHSSTADCHSFDPSNTKSTVT